MTHRRTARLAIGVAVASLTTCFSVTGIASADTARPSDPAAPIDMSSSSTVDSFVIPPAGWQQQRIGSVLRSRSLQLGNYPLPAGTQAWQLLYRTTDQYDKPMVTVTTVLRPGTEAPAGLISYQIAEDASSTRCAPSSVLNPGSVVPANIDSTSISGALNNGFAVSIPDYEGPLSEFAAPRQPGYAILDAVRAANHFPALGLTGARTPVGLWGYSGGSLASGWAAEIQPRYAPTMNLKGVALGGYVNDIKATLLQVNRAGSPISALLPGGLAGMFRGVPALKAEFAPYLTPEGQAMVALGGSQCVTENFFTFPNFNADNYLTIPYATLLNRPDVSRTLATLNLGSVTPKAPLLVYHAIKDQAAPVRSTDGLVKKFCATGGSVTYLRSKTGDHVTLQTSGESQALLWLSSRLNDSKPPRGCSTATVATIG
jgi:secretory lipase